MKEEDSNWFSKWDEELPSPEELTPLSQSLITPDLALAFNIPPPMPSNQSLRRTTPPPPPPTSQPNSSAEFDSPELSGAATGTGSDEPARTLKRPRLVWTPQLHKRFVDAVAHLGIKNAVPKTIMQLMSVDGLTRENVASHLQKYRLYLKRMQGISSSGTGTGIPESATDHLFASAPVPAHFLHPNRTNSDHFFAAMPAHHQMAIVGAPPQPQAAHHHHPQLRQHFGNSHQFETHPYIRQAQQRLHPVGGGYVEDLESGNGGGNGRKVLTLFPTGND